MESTIAEKNRMQLDKSHIDQVEHNISPPMALAITLPVDDVNSGICVYVVASPFSERVATAKQLKDVAERLMLN
jgi:hypothetical protein